MSAVFFAFLGCGFWYRVHMELALSGAGPPRPQMERLTSRPVLISSLVFLTIAALCPLDRCGATSAGSSDQRNVVADYLNGAKEDFQGNDHRQVVKQALTDMLDEPVERLRKKEYPDYEMHPHSWPVTLVLSHYFVPNPPEFEFEGDRFFRDVKKPEAQNAIRGWLDLIDRLGAKVAGADHPRNIVADYLNGAEEQSESDDQREVIKQAFIDMLIVPVESLRKKRYPDYQMHPNRWPITELLNRYIVPGAPVWFKGDEFFRDVKKSEAQKLIRIWLDYENRPSGIEGPPGPPPLNRP